MQEDVVSYLTTFGAIGLGDLNRFVHFIVSC